MDKFVETFLYTIITFLILLIIAFIGHLVLFVLTDIGDILTVLGFTLIFVIIFVVIYHLWGDKVWRERNIDERSGTISTSGF